MLSLSLAQLAAAGSAPIRFEDLGLSPNLFTIGSFSLRWYSLAYLAGILLAYWHTSKACKACLALLDCRWPMSSHRRSAGAKGRFWAASWTRFSPTALSPKP